MSKIDEILVQLQYGTAMADNTEPMLTNNRSEAKTQLLQLAEEIIGDNEPYCYLDSTTEKIDKMTRNIERRLQRQRAKALFEEDSNDRP